MQKIKLYLSHLVFLLALSSCAVHQESHVAEYPVGDISSQSLLDNYESFNLEFERYHVNEVQLSTLKKLPNDLTIDIYFATWCHDSIREVPRMLRLLQHATAIKSNLLALDYNKQEPQGRAVKAGVKYTPTFIIKRQGKEIGRIVERPKTDLLNDIKNMI